jgi:hypothetical protein
LPAAICATISAPMAALSSSIVVPVVTVGVMVTAGSVLPRVIVCPVDDGADGPRKSVPASVATEHTSGVLPTVEYSDSMSMSALPVTSFRYPGPNDLTSERTSPVQNTGTACTLDMTGPPQYVATPHCPDVPNGVWCPLAGAPFPGTGTKPTLRAAFASAAPRSTMPHRTHPASAGAAADAPAHRRRETRVMLLTPLP